MQIVGHRDIPKLDLKDPLFKGKNLFFMHNRDFLFISFRIRILYPILGALADKLTFSA